MQAPTTREVRVVAARAKMARTRLGIHDPRAALRLSRTNPPVPTFFSLTFDYPRGTLPTGGGGDDARGDTRERGGGYHRGEGGPREVARARVRVVGRPGTRAPRRAQTSRGGDPRGATRRVRVARGGPQSATVRARRVGDGGQRMGRGATENTSSRALSRRRAASQVVHPSLVRRFVDGG